jgi:DNA-binding transcriptional MocR family regulator
MIAHRRAGARWIAQTGLSAPVERVIVTGGGQYGIAMSIAGIAEPGDVVLTEALTYPGLMALARLHHLRLAGVAMDEEGMNPDALEAALRAGPVRAIYVVPTLQNPTTRVMSEARRRQIAAIAAAYDVILVEDDAYGFLVPNPPPPIAAFAPKHAVYLSSTSKNLAPGLRIGHALVPQHLVDRMLAAIRATSWMAVPGMAELVSRAILDGTAERLVQAKRREATERQAIARDLLAGYEMETKPTSFHLWMNLPSHWRSLDFARAVRDQGVAISPAEAFAVPDRGGGRGTAPAAIRISLGGVKTRERLTYGLGVVAHLAGHRPDSAPGAESYLSIV